MRDERGQASIEWVGAVLIVALALAGLARLAGRVDVADLGATPLRATICAVGGGCGEPGGERMEHAGRGRADSRFRRHAVVAPPPLPPASGPRPEPPRTAAPRRPSPARDLARRARRPAGALWRRAWLLCFGYERVRYGLLHPESAPRQTVPIRGALQMVNDCASPVDFARDWELLRGR